MNAQVVDCNDLPHLSVRVPSGRWRPLAGALACLAWGGVPSVGGAGPMTAVDVAGAAAAAPRPEGVAAAASGGRPASAGRAVPRGAGAGALAEGVSRLHLQGGGDDDRPQPAPPRPGVPEAPSPRPSAPSVPAIGAATWRHLGDLYAARAAAAYARARQLGDATAPWLPTGAAEPPAAAPAAVVQPPHAAPGSDSVIAAIQAWAAHWRTRDIAGYLSDYTDDYTGRAATHAAWEAARRERLGRAGRIDVRLSALVVDVQGPVAVARFTQRYASDTYSDVSRKYLRLEWRQGRGWLIARETVVE